MSVIKAKNIIKTYANSKDKEGVKVLNDVSIEIKETEFVTIMGPSGSGKSTLLFALSGMDKVDEGEVRFEGCLLKDLKEKELADLRRNKMGFVFQQPTFLKNLSIIDNIVLPALRDNKGQIGEIKERATELMESMGISGLADRDITAVSGGQLQRAGICRAMICNPKIIMGDEPTGALNSKASDEVMDIFQRINQEGVGVVLVTHDVRVAARSERVLVMNDGKICEEIIMGKHFGGSLEERIEKLLSLGNKL